MDTRKGFSNPWNDIVVPFFSQIAEGCLILLTGGVVYSQKAYDRGGNDGDDEKDQHPHEQSEVVVYRVDPVEKDAFDGP